MSEGTARDLVIKAIQDSCCWVRVWNDRPVTDPPDQEYNASTPEATADRVLAALTEAGALAPAGLTVWAVDHVHTPWVSHGRNTVALFSTEEAAEAHAARCRAWHAEAEAVNRGLLAAQGFDVTKMAPDETEYAVEEWRVDDPALASPAADAATGEPS